MLQLGPSSLQKLITMVSMYKELQLQHFYQHCLDICRLNTKHLMLVVCIIQSIKIFSVQYLEHSIFFRLAVSSLCLLFIQTQSSLHKVQKLARALLLGRVFLFNKNSLYFIKYVISIKILFLKLFIFLVYTYYMHIIFI